MDLTISHPGTTLAMRKRVDTHADAASELLTAALGGSVPEREHVLAFAQDLLAYPTGELTTVRGHALAYRLGDDIA